MLKWVVLSGPFAQLLRYTARLMLEVLQYDSARPELQALHLNENPRSKRGKRWGKKDKKGERKNRI